jgi:RHS repeat-associated protein
VGLGQRNAEQKYAVADGVRQKFTGYEKDEETRLDFAQARYYGNGLGRFTSVDPLQESARLALPQSWNRYSYVLNNPLNMIDPFGLDWGIVGNVPTFYATPEERLKAGVPAFRPFEGIFKDTLGYWHRLNDDGTMTDVTPWVDWLKIEALNIVTGGLYQDVIRTRDGWCSKSNVIHVLITSWL